VRGECCGRTGLGGTHSGLVAIATVFGGKNQALEARIVVALGPAVVAVFLEEHDFFRGQGGFLLGFVDLRPVGMELVAPMLRNVDAVVCLVNAEAFGVSDAGGVALCGQESLIGLLRVVAPDASTSIELSARIGAGGMQSAVLQLAGIGGRSHVDVEHAVVAYVERVHGMVAPERQARDHRHWRISGDEAVGGQLIPDDAVIDLDVKGAFVERDACAAVRAVLRRSAEAFDNIGLAGARLVLKGDKESALVDGFAGGIIASGPCVDVDDVVWGDDKMPGVTDAIGEDRGAETLRKLQVAVVAGAHAIGGEDCCVVWVGWHTANEGTKSSEDTEDKGSRDKEPDRHDRPHETLLDDDGIISTKPNRTSLVLGSLPFAIHAMPRIA
jgi:hypothetical protein